MKAPLLFMLTADLECLLEKMHACQNNLEKYYADKRIKHTPSGYSIFTNCSFDSAKKKKKKKKINNFTVTKVKIVWKVFAKT